MLTLQWKAETSIPVEAECIRPDQLADQNLDEIRALTVFHGNRKERLGDYFTVSGDASDQNVLVEGDCRRVKWIGAGMTTGKITVQGNVGMHCGSEMSGGSIDIQGNAGDWLGAELRGGLIQVKGDAGHLVRAAYRGAEKGMRGGVILVHGSAGNEVAGHMRRGLIAIGGTCGDFTGVSMIAGSVFLFGKIGVRLGAGMKRGSLILLYSTIGSEEDPDAISEARSDLLSTFRYNCSYRPAFLDIYLREIRRLGMVVPERCFEGLFTRFSGDLVALGKGEILIHSG